MLLFILQVIWFLVPAAVANGTPPLAARLLPQWNAPMDFYLHLAGKRLFGAHKTIRGLVSGVLMAAVAHRFQVYLADEYAFFASLPLSPAFNEYAWLGAWMGFTALMGDAIKSLIKRQVNIAPGKPWLPWDKIDWVIGVLLGSCFLPGMSLPFAFTAIIIGLLISTIGRIIGYVVNINKEWL